MGEEQMDLIVGVDFGMTCTGETKLWIQPALPDGPCFPLSPNRPSLCAGLGDGRCQRARLDSLHLPRQLTPKLLLRSLLRKSIHRLQYYQMDPKLAWKGARQREQGAHGPCVREPR